MLEKPDLPDEQIAACLQEAYGFQVTGLTFLPLGADLHSAVYRAGTGCAAPYFVKLRRGPFLEASVSVPRFLYEQGVAQIIPPLPTLTGHLRAALGDYSVVLYPFVAGHDGYETPVSDRQRIDLGAVLRTLHTTRYPPAVIAGVPNESFSPRWRSTVSAHLDRCERRIQDDAPAQELGAFLGSKRAEVLDLITRAQQLAQALRAAPQEFVLCHGDIHGWNMHIAADGRLFIVDWDDLVMAPRERDLMFVGSGLGGRGHTLAEEERLFYEGYGLTQINAAALAYYRFERIIADTAAYCEEIFELSGSPGDRQQAVANVRSNFRPGGTIARAYRAAADVGGG